MCRMSAALLIFISSFTAVMGHGRLADPPSRNAMWMYGFSNPRNTDPNAMNCGGAKNHWQTNGGKCGLCGDPYQGPRRHEGGYPGGYANGIIGRVYKQGQHIQVMVEITANHLGWFEFRLCPHNNPSRPETQACFEKYLLASPAGETRHPLNLQGYKGTARISLVLPPDVTCSQCVLQWFYYAGNNVDKIEQETFVNCADVAITRQDGTLGGGLVMPKIPEAAYKPIQATPPAFGQGKTVGLPGKWDCTVPPPHGNTEKKNVFYGWCLENCLYALPHERSCPVETCRCFRTDVTMNPDEERKLLGVKDPYPVIQNGKVKDMSQGYLEGTWICDVVSPFDQDPGRKAMFKSWCQTHCIEARPQERDCPASHCKCRRTDKKLSEEEERRLVQKVGGQSSKVVHAVTPVSLSDNVYWKSEAKMKSKPNGLKGTWDCDVPAPFNQKADKRLQTYEWCLQNCINAIPSDKDCPESHCNCYRTDVRLSPEENRAQLRNEKVVILTASDQERRGIPPTLKGLVSKTKHTETNAGGSGDNPADKYVCEVLPPFNDFRKAKFLQYCYDSCVLIRADQRHCPETHCKCYEKQNPRNILRTA